MKMAVGCKRITGFITERLGSAEGAIEFGELLRRQASAAEITEAFTAHADAELAALMLEEFAELPENFVPTFMAAWALAQESGRSFTMASRAPERPLEQARQGRVSYTIDHDEQGVTMYVSHVAGHHARWYRPRTLVA